VLYVFKHKTIRVKLLYSFIYLLINIVMAARHIFVLFLLRYTLIYACQMYKKFITASIFNK